MRAQANEELSALHHGRAAHYAGGGRGAAEATGDSSKMEAPFCPGPQRADGDPGKSPECIGSFEYRRLRLLMGFSVEVAATAVSEARRFFAYDAPD